MKKIFLISLAIFSYIEIFAQIDNKSFLSIDKVPDATFYLPSPPDTSSVAFINDFYRYQDEKSKRNTDRGKQASFDTYWQTDSILRGFASSFDFLITKESAPITYNLINKVCIDAELGIKKAKQQYLRKRPYVQFHEHPGNLEQEIELRNNGSYPSGHSARGWAVALILTELKPERQNLILDRGYQYGESRIIEGYHYQSDVEASRLAASAVVASLHSNNLFLKEISKAKKEIERLNSKK